jgi:replication factor A1
MHKANSTTFNFACRAKQDTYNVGSNSVALTLLSLIIRVQEQIRVRYGISRIMPLDYREESAYLRDLLRTPWAK